MWNVQNDANIPDLQLKNIPKEKEGTSLEIKTHIKQQLTIHTQGQADTYTHLYTHTHTHTHTQLFRIKIFLMN